MGEEPVGDLDDALDETEGKNITFKRRTWQKLAAEYPHALEPPSKSAW